MSAIHLRAGKARRTSIGRSDQGIDVIQHVEGLVQRLASVSSARQEGCDGRADERPGQRQRLHGSSEERTASDEMQRRTQHQRQCQCQCPRGSDVYRRAFDGMLLRTAESRGDRRRPTCGVAAFQQRMRFLEKFGVRSSVMSYRIGEMVGRCQTYPD